MECSVHEFWKYQQGNRTLLQIWNLSWNMDQHFRSHGCGVWWAPNMKNYSRLKEHFRTLYYVVYDILATASHQTHWIWLTALESTRTASVMDQRFWMDLCDHFQVSYTDIQTGEHYPAKTNCWFRTYLVELIFSCNQRQSGSSGIRHQHYSGSSSRRR